MATYTLSAADEAAINSLKEAYAAAQAAGDTAAMESAHNQAEAIRASYGYSGGTDGSEYIALTSDSGTSATSTTGTSNTATSATTGTATAGTTTSGTTASTTSGTTTGTTTSSYDSTLLSESDQAAIAYLQSLWAEAQAAGDTTTMENAHALAESIRASYGYSGGTDGSQYLAATSTGNTATDTSYTALGSYNDAGLSTAAKAKIAALQEQYAAAIEAGDTALAQSLHEQAELIRASYGYSGGVDGSQYLSVDLDDGILAYTGLPTYEAQIDAVNALYDAQQTATLTALESAYNSAKSELEASIAKIPEAYNTAANSVAAQAEIAKKSFNESAASSGLNSGTGSQAALSLNNQLQSSLSTLSAQQASAISDAETSLANLYTEYQSNIATAIANNEYERAAALLAEYQTAANSVVSVAQTQAYLDLETDSYNQSVTDSSTASLLQRAETLAQYGDFSGYLALGYTQDEVNTMQKAWIQQNLELAYSLGYLTL